jgi:hypothetical protein
MFAKKNLFHYCLLPARRYCTIKCSNASPIIETLLARRLEWKFPSRIIAQRHPLTVPEFSHLGISFVFSEENGIVFSNSTLQDLESMYELTTRRLSEWRSITKVQVTSSLPTVKFHRDAPQHFEMTE